MEGQGESRVTFEKSVRVTRREVPVQEEEGQT